MTSEITQINRAEALRYMGYTHEPDERISAVIDQCEQELLKEARPQFVWRVFNIQRSGREIFLSDCDFELEGHDIAEHLRGCDKAAVVCSTLSSSADRFLKKLDVSDSMKALITDALANAMVEQVNEEARQDIINNMPGYATTWCYGAGYGDFPIECAHRFRGCGKKDRRMLHGNSYAHTQENHHRRYRSVPRRTGQEAPELRGLQPQGNLQIPCLRHTVLIYFTVTLNLS